MNLGVSVRAWRRKCQEMIGKRALTKRPKAEGKGQRDGIKKWDPMARPRYVLGFPRAFQHRCGHLHLVSCLWWWLLNLLSKVSDSNQDAELTESLSSSGLFLNSVDWNSAVWHKLGSLMCRSRVCIFGAYICQSGDPGDRQMRLLALLEAHWVWMSNLNRGRSACE